jgi:uncharacterized protein (TIRG00374 family)
MEVSSITGDDPSAESESRPEPVVNVRKRSSWRQTAVRLLIGSAVTATFLWLFLRQASLGAAWDEIRKLPGWSIAAALGFVLANSAFIALRWRYLFAAARYSTTARGLFPLYCVGAGANNIIPARGGDLLRIAAASDRYRIPAFVTAGTLFAERLLDGVVLAVWILMGALMIGETGPLLLAGVGLSVGTAIGLVLAALTASHPASAERLVWRLTRWLPSRWHSKIGRATADFVLGLGAFRRRHSLWRVAWTSVAIWLADLGLYIVVGIGFGVDLGAGAYFLLEGVGNLALGVPATAAGLGSFDYLTLVSAKELDVPSELATPYVLTVHAMVVLPVTILGALLLRQAFPRLFGGRSVRAARADRD